MGRDAKVARCTIIREKKPADGPSYGFLIDGEGLLLSVESSASQPKPNAKVGATLTPADAKVRNLAALPVSATRANVELKRPHAAERTAACGSPRRSDRPREADVAVRRLQRGARGVRKLRHDARQDRQCGAVTWWSMIFSDLPTPAEASIRTTGLCRGFAQAGNRFTPFGIMLSTRASARSGACPNPTSSRDSSGGPRS